MHRRHNSPKYPIDGKLLIILASKILKEIHPRANLKILKILKARKTTKEDKALS